jgi:hypothetical protein
MKKYQKLKFIKLFEAFKVESVESFKVFESLNSQELIDDIDLQIEKIVDETDIEEKNPAYPVMEMILNKIKKYFLGKYEFGDVEADDDGYKMKTDKIAISIQEKGDSIVIKTSGDDLWNGNREMEIIEIKRTGGENRYSDSYEQEGLILTLKNSGNDLDSFLVGVTEDISRI